jgi:hypothetical protein
MLKIGGVMDRTQVAHELGWWVFGMESNGLQAVGMIVSLGGKWSK